MPVEHQSQKISKVDTRIERTSHGLTGLLMSLPFIGIGCFFSFAGFLELDILKEGANAPLWVLGFVGLIFLLCGVMLFVFSVTGLLLRQTLKHKRQRFPNQPWRYDYPWSPRGVADNAVARVATSIGGVIVLTVFLVPFVWWAFFSPDDRLPVRIIVSVFMLIWVFILGTAVYRLAQFAKYGSSHLSFQRFPFIPNQPITVGIQNQYLTSLSATLRFVEEKYVRTGYGKEASTSHVCLQHYAETRLIDCEPRSFVSFSFELPSDQQQRLTRMIADPSIVYWELLLESETPGIDYRATFPLPVYEGTSANVVTNPSFGRRRTFLPDWLPLVPFELKAVLIPIAIALAGFLFAPDAMRQHTNRLYHAVLGVYTNLQVERFRDYYGDPMQLEVNGDALHLVTKYTVIRHDLDSGAQGAILDNRQYREIFNRPPNAFSSVLYVAPQLYVGSWYGELYAYEQERWRQLVSRDEFGIGKINQMVQEDGRVLLAGNGLYEWDPDQGLTTLLAGPQVTSILPFERDLLLARGKRIDRRTGSGKVIIWVNLSSRINTLYMSQGGKILAGTNDGLVDVTDRQNPEKLLADTVVNRIVMDRDGRLIAGTRKQGVLISGQSGSESSWVRVAGLPGEHVLDLSLDEARDSLWVAFYDDSFSRIPYSLLVGQANVHTAH